MSSITRLGATPLFVDIEPGDYLLSAPALEKLLGQRACCENGRTVDAKTGLRIKALLPVHLFGQCSAMEEFLFLAQSGLIGDNGIISIPPPLADKTHVFNNYVVRAQRRDELKNFLAERGIQSEVYYPLPLHLQECFAGLEYKKGDFPAAELAATQVLALPLYPELAADEQDYIVSAIREFFRA